MATTTYVYDDRDPARPPARPPGSPARIVETIESPAWTPEDRALLIALEIAEESECPGCRIPRSIAWHSDMDGWWSVESYVCHACTARSRAGDSDTAEKSEPVTYLAVRNTRPGDTPLTPFQLGKTTSSS